MSRHVESTVPVNLGSDELVSINQLVDIVEDIAGIKCERNYKLDAPQGVRGRNSDNTQIKETYGWAPSITLADGLAKTYARSEEHTSELQSLMRISYAVFCLKKKTQTN